MLLGSQQGTGGGGRVLLRVGLDGALREVAGGSVDESGWSKGSSRGRGKSLEVESNSGQWLMQVLVVELSVCGG